MGFLECIEENFTTIMLFSAVHIVSIIIAYFYQKIRVEYDGEGNCKVRFMNKIIQYIWSGAIVAGPAILVGVREFNVGADTMNYVLGYLRKGASIDKSMLSGVNQLFYIIRYFIFKISNGNPTVFLTAIAFLTLIILVRALDKFIDRVSLPMALMIYYMLLGMQLLNQSRQMLAISIILYALTDLLESRYMRYIGFVVMASLIHVTAIVALIFPLMQFKAKRVNKINKLLYIIIWLTIPFFMPQILKISSAVLPMYYRHYVLETTFMKIGFGLILNIAPVFIPIILYRKYINNEENAFFVRIAVLAFPFRLAGYYSYFLMRLQYYSYIFMILIIPMIFSRIDGKLNKTVSKIIIIGLFAMYYIITYLYLNDSRILPYESIF